jgi:hypothetical protein
VDADAVIDIDAHELANLERALTSGAVDDAIGDAAELLVPDIAAAAQAAVRTAARPHRRTGKLEAAITLERDGRGIATTAEVRAGDVAAIIAGGSVPHEIRSHGHALRLVGGSVTGFASSVHHPGTAPDPFVTRGAAAAEGETASLVDAGAAHLADELATRLTEG